VWLERHLQYCVACAIVAADFAAQQAELKGLAELHPPRDLWARTATALDRAERQAIDIPSPSVFPGRGGRPGSRGSRSIRGLRAEQRALAYRAGPRPQPSRALYDRPRRAPRPSGAAWLAPFGALAALAIIVVVGGSSLLNATTFGPVRPPATSPTALVANATATVAVTPVATPIQVGASEVAWLTPADDGSYSFNFARVDLVCPAAVAPDCAPIEASAPQRLPTVRTALHTVLRSPSRTQLVVMTTGTKQKTGGSLIVVSIPTQAPAIATTASPSQATVPTPTAAVIPDPTASPETTAGPEATDAAPENTPAPSDSVVDSPAPSSIPPVVAATADPSPREPTPTPTAADPTIDPSPTETSAPDPTGPEPTATALAIISDVVIVGESASYSPDGTMLAFSARPADGSHGPDIYLWRPDDAAAYPVTADHASVFSGWLNNQLLGSRAVDATGNPASGPAPDIAAATIEPADAISALPDLLPRPAPSAVRPQAGAPDGVTSGQGGYAGFLAGGSATRSQSVNAEGAGSVSFGQADPSTVVASSFILDPATGTETTLAAPAWRPVVDPTGRFVVYWAGSLRYDVPSLTWVPDQGLIVIDSWTALRGADPTATLAPVPLLDEGGTSVPPGEWDIRWDELGQHVAAWAADADNPELGRLTLRTIDSTGRVDVNGVSLQGTPALAGFSFGGDRLAWASPPGQNGEGSRLQVLAWSGTSAGQIDSQPVFGGDAVVVVR